ncbi:ABC transporter substrate-binding protein [Bradyrhizobium valentinum]|uniref:ABC transporter substrate-binding protein n=1 Tax=Bradyrhizobium valentinum TaxID=1518501 RepID=UPI00070A8E10|nr:ABC transporter substrate-binding protein [Bradyrhizobium valentinum]KRQ95427.1 hypothetical protein CQ10_32705 [Bradyrhizobium valentinum]
MTIDRRRFLQLSAAASLPLTLPKSSFAIAKHSGTDLVVAVQSNPPQFDPLRLQTNIAFRVLANVYDFPFRTEFRKELVRRLPGLAEESRWVDERTIELKLRNAVKFHSGDQMTAEDFAFSFGPERMGPDVPGGPLAKQYFASFESVSAVDNLTVRIRTTSVDPLLEMRLAGWGSQIISKRAFLASGGWDKWALSPVATGPYKVANVRTGDFVRLEAHEAYWGGSPVFRSVTFKVVPDAAGRANGLLAGDYHIATDISPDQLGIFEGQHDIEPVGGQIFNMRVLNYDATEGLLKDPRIRQALDAAIDRDAIAKSLFAGKVEVPRGFQWPAYGDIFIESEPPLRRNLALAKRLLSEASYKGEPIPYRVLSDYYTAELTTAQILVQMWKEAGLNIQLQICENWTQVWAKPNGGIFNGSINLVYPDPAGTLWPLYGPTGFIRTSSKSWSDADFDELGSRLLATADRAERKALHAKILQIFGHDNPPGTPLHFSAMFYGQRKDVAWSPVPLPYMDFGPFNVKRS